LKTETLKIAKEEPPLLTELAKKKFYLFGFDLVVVGNCPS